MHNNVFDLPELTRVGSSNPFSTADSSISRLEGMNKLISSNSLEHILCGVQANLELLHIKAKNYHWNVSGAGFQGVHGMFDELEDYAREAGDRIAERMRFHCVKVDATASNYLGRAWFREGNADLDMDGMLSDVCMTLMCIIEKMDEFDSDLCTYPVDQSMLQEINEGLGKFCYFVKSNMSHSSGDVSY
ncbi:integrase [Escherichia phage IME267]|uniref:Integrase n=1 Tax=Escherichia phage IME267 TaxID=2860374 RepID=A0AAE7WEW1_9CAUD|nr:integrase [Escherichia phage IME267]QYC96940.1 integrase [Escherichia phage IME267]